MNKKIKVMIITLFLVVLSIQNNSLAKNVKHSNPVDSYDYYSWTSWNNFVEDLVFRSGDVLPLSSFLILDPTVANYPNPEMGDLLKQLFSQASSFQLNAGNTIKETAQKIMYLNSVLPVARMEESYKAPEIPEKYNFFDMDIRLVCGEIMRSLVLKGDTTSIYIISHWNDPETRDSAGPFFYILLYLANEKLRGNWAIEEEYYKANKKLFDYAFDVNEKIGTNFTFKEKAQKRMKAIDYLALYTSEKLTFSEMCSK